MIYLKKMVPYSVYLHIPFCHSRCDYCDFNTYAGLENLIPAYLRALCSEIEFVAAAAGERLPVHTIFFGGGTPSLLSVSNVEQILNVLERNFIILPEPEISLEANPGTLSLDSLKGLRKCGVNRLSLGVQSAHPDELRLLGRQHDFLDVIHALSWARRAGFEQINLDLIYGLPNQSVQTWLTTVNHTLDLNPDHFSLYALGLEHGTPMKSWMDRGLLEEVDADQAAEMYEAASSLLADAGYVQYEVSNWAWESMEGDLLACRHNLQYWRNRPYFGFGAGAHGYVRGFRVANVLFPATYIERISNHKPDAQIAYPQSPAAESVEFIDRENEMAETMILGLRLIKEGVSADAFAERFQVSLEEIYGEKIEKLRKWGLVEWAGERSEILRITEHARLIANQVFVEFM